VIGKKVKLWAVVKSNAYGHGLYAFSKLMEEFGIDGLCVDSVVEAISLRDAGVTKPILVLGQTLPARFEEAAEKGITISISNFEALQALARAKQIPDFHVKIDTGMHRQGFYVKDVLRVIKIVNVKKGGFAKHLRGIFTHFASAKDINYPTFTDAQVAEFKKAIASFEKAGFKDLVKHASATGGTLINKKYHFDAVRVGIGLYGLWPSKELEVQLGDTLLLSPVLSWRAVIAEVKPVKKGEYVGYNMTERLAKDEMVAIIPVGYWHGLPWSLSGVGEVIVRGRRARILGRISMDMLAIALPGAGKVGDVVTFIGRDGKEMLTPEEQSAKSATTMNYEFITRLNPLMERVIIR
jgi:alanine racemase